MDIVSAKDRPLDQQMNELPNLGPALTGLMVPVALGVVTQQMIHGLSKEVVNVVSTKCVRQAFTATQLMMRPEGARDWKWWSLHFPAEIVLATNDRVEILGVPYRVMEVYDHQAYGYMHYNVIEDYRRAS